MPDFKLPDLGEGVTEAEIDKWLVREGDVIAEDAPLVEVITDKATAEIPSPFEGRVARIHVEPGQVVPVGTVLVTIESEAAEPEAPVSADPHETTTSGGLGSWSAPTPTSGAEPATELDVPGEPATDMAAEGAGAPGDATGDDADPIEVAPVEAEGAENAAVGEPDAGSGDVVPPSVPDADAIKATPPVRRLARDLGVELTRVRGRGPGGRITREDVEAAAQAAREPAPEPPHIPPPPPSAADAPVPADFQDTAPPSGDAGHPPDAPVEPEESAGEPVAAASPDVPDRIAISPEVISPPVETDSEHVAGPPAARDVVTDEGHHDLPPPPPPVETVPPAEEPAAVAETTRDAGDSPLPSVPPPPVAIPTPEPDIVPTPDAEPELEVAAPVADVAPADAPARSTTSREQGGRRESLRGIRRTIAQRMSHAHLTIPPVTHVEECDVTELDDTRRLANESNPEGTRMTFLPFIVKAVVSGLKEFPSLNASLDDEAGEIVYHDRYDIGVAVDTPGGLLVPVVRDADQKGLATIAADIERLAAGAREGTLMMEELRGSTFTITSPGPWGGLMATPIVFHPQSGILGVHRATDRPVVRDGQIVIRKMMNVSITFDHRILDGLTAAKFALHVVKLLEHPATLALGAG